MRKTLAVFSVLAIAVLLLATPGLAADKGMGVPHFKLFGRIAGFEPAEPPYEYLILGDIIDASGLVPDVEYLWVQVTEDTECYYLRPGPQTIGCIFSIGEWKEIYGTVSGGDLFADRYPQS